jgi:hypothetical protein
MPKIIGYGRSCVNLMDGTRSNVQTVYWSHTLVVMRRFAAKLMVQAVGKSLIGNETQCVRCRCYASWEDTLHFPQTRQFPGTTFSEFPLVTLVTEQFT